MRLITILYRPHWACEAKTTEIKIGHGGASLLGGEGRDRRKAKHKSHSQYAHCILFNITDLIHHLISSGRMVTKDEKG